MKPKPHKPEYISKGWGCEIVFANNAKYCGKQLCIKKGHEFSMHAHRNKLETFWLTEGRVCLRTIDTDNADVDEAILEAGDVVNIPRMLPHQILALEDSKIVEFSTHHEDSDSYRYFKGDSQR